VARRGPDSARAAIAVAIAGGTALTRWPYSGRDPRSVVVATRTPTGTTAAATPRYPTQSVRWARARRRARGCMPPPKHLGRVTATDFRRFLAGHLVRRHVTGGDGRAPGPTGESPGPTASGGHDYRRIVGADS